MNQEPQYRTIGKYQILGTLGRGAMGVVYKARDPAIGRVVAVKTLRKVLPAELKEGNVAIERFTIEARSAGNLRHPNLITIFDFSVDGDVPFIVMDFVEGRTLSSVISEAGRLSAAQTIHYLSQIAAGLDYAHSRGVLHRDIKPSNILVDKSDHVYVLDFGVASINESFSATPGKKKEELVMGTPGYMAPEQILNKHLDHRSDLFALAVVTFECMTGRRPFPGDTFTAVVEKILAVKAVAISSILPGASLELEAVFDRAFARDKEARFNSARELIEAIKRAVGDTGIGGALAHSGTVAPRQFASWKAVGGEVPRVSAGREDSGAHDKTSVSMKVRMSSGGAQPRPLSEQLGPDLVNAQPTRAGDIFAHSSDSLVRPELGWGRKSWVRLATFGLGLVCLALAVAIGVMVVEAFKKPSDSGSVAPIEISRNPVRVEIPNKPMVELSDAEILAVLQSPELDEADLARALGELQERKLAGAFDALVQLLKHESYVIRREATRSLAASGDRRVVPEIIVLLDDLDPLVRATAAQALGQLGDRKAEAYLNTRLSVETDAKTRRELERALSTLAGEL